MKNISAIILAAGKGTRMKSDLPKVLHKVNGKAMINHVIDLAREIGIEKIVVVIGFGKEMVKVETAYQKVLYAVQEQQLGTGHAVQICKEHFENDTGDVLVLSGDVPLLTSTTLETMLNLHQKETAHATLLTASLDDPHGYGRIVRDADGTVLKNVEEKDADDKMKAIKEINAGIYLFKVPDLFAALPKIKNDNLQGEYYLPDLIGDFVSHGKKVIPVLTENFAETMGVNTEAQLAEVEAILVAREQ